MIYIDKDERIIILYYCLFVDDLANKIRRLDINLYQHILQFLLTKTHHLNMDTKWFDLKLIEYDTHVYLSK